MRKNLLVPLAVSLLFLSSANGQERTGGRACADLPGQTLSTRRFRQLGDTIEISIRGKRAPADVADCEPVALELRWTNGRNNGGNFNVTFLDGNNRPIYAKQISAFLTGVFQFPLSSFDAQPVYGSAIEMISVPTTITIQAVSPFAAPASLSYMVTRVARAPTRKEKEEDEREKTERDGNEVVSIHNAVRLIGASRLPLVQIELKTSRPFPVRDVPLRLRIGKKIFVDELSGDYTGRKLTLSLMPEMFAELKDGDEIQAFFSEPQANGLADAGVWRFGKLRKTVNSEQ